MPAPRTMRTIARTSAALLARSAEHFSVVIAGKFAAATVAKKLFVPVFYELFAFLSALCAIKL